ncbi:hypothetical protein EG68_11659 [Paragonimus skrjabini miyazakii]|uniref:Uncharacterized protein n=1 Tax=Paragonimus skrjabini miyazakii TaxID=59628 RepID=A0A8S9YE76_9TREM|nr:hypothetical protein EG68_11659 [Paragonimus skrjabini miyazakii]
MSCKLWLLIALLLLATSTTAAAQVSAGESTT